MNMNAFWKHVTRSAVVVWGLVLIVVVFRLEVPTAYYIGLGVGLTIGAYWKAIE